MIVTKKPIIYIVILFFVSVGVGSFLGISSQSAEDIRRTSDLVSSVGDSGTQTEPATVLEEGIIEGKLARDFSLNTIDGEIVKLSDFRGRYVLFASMATWCTPCRIEAQNVRAAQENFENSLLTVIQVDVDPRETNQDLVRFRQELGREDWIMGFDDGSISNLYNIRTFDTTLVVDPMGKVIYRDEGFPIDSQTLEDLIV